MNRQNPWSHAMVNINLITMTVSEIWDHCQNLLDDPRICRTDKLPPLTRISHVLFISLGQLGD